MTVTMSTDSGSRTMSMESDAATGAALRAVTDFLPVYAQVFVRLGEEQRRAVVEDQLTRLGERAIVPIDQIAELRTSLTGQGTGFRPGPDGDRRGPGRLEVIDVLRAAAVAPVMVSGGFLDMLWDAACTLAGALLGDVVAGPAGAPIGAYYGHQFAQQYPPSTWFE